MPRPRTQPPDVRRRIILNAARAALAARGYQELRLDEVARLADVAKGTLYLHFNDKMDLLRGVFDDILDRLKERLDEIPEKGTALERLRETASTALSFIDEHQDFIIVFKGGHPDLLRSKAGERTQRRHEAHLRQVAARLRACVEEGSLRRHDTLTGALYFNALLRLFMDLKELKGSPKNLASKKGDFMTLLTRGLGKSG
ncbi:MAG: TetR/AcrR family transcriptional regulator [Elusimicrobiota bacterium]